MNNYELTYIIDPRVEDSERKALVERFSSLIESNGGVISKVDETIWGKRKLAYPINDLTEGYYVLVTFQSESNVPREIERNLQISDKILRYLVIKVEEKRKSVKPKTEKKEFVSEKNDEVEAVNNTDESQNSEVNSQEIAE